MVMKYFLVRPSDISAAWQEIIEHTTSPNERLAPVRKLIMHLGRSLALFGFFDSRHFWGVGQAHIVQDKLVLWSGHNSLTVLAMPSIEVAHAFKMVVSAEARLKDVDLAPSVPMDHVVQAMAAAKEAVSQIGYAAPGRTKLSSHDKLVAGDCMSMDARTSQPQP